MDRFRLASARSHPRSSRTYQLSSIIEEISATVHTCRVVLVCSSTWSTETKERARRISFCNGKSCCFCFCTSMRFPACLLCRPIFTDLLCSLKRAEIRKSGFRWKHIRDKWIKENSCQDLFRFTFSFFQESCRYFPSLLPFYFLVYYLSFGLIYGR